MAVPITAFLSLALAVDITFGAIIPGVPKSGTLNFCYFDI